MRRKWATSSGPRRGGTTTLIADPNAKESRMKRKAGRGSSQLKISVSPLHDTSHRDVFRSGDSRTDEVCERTSLPRILNCFARVYAEEPVYCWPKDLTSLSENGSLESTGNVSCGYHRNGQCGNHVSRIWLGPERPRGSQDLPSCHARHSRPRGARSRAVAGLPFGRPAEPAGAQNQSTGP